MFWRTRIGATNGVGRRCCAARSSGSSALPDSRSMPARLTAHTCLLGALWWTLSTFAASTSTSTATAMVPLSIRELTAQADWVARGIVAAKSSRRDPGGHIASQVNLDVIEMWKGQPPSGRLALAVASGVLGEQEVRAEHEPEYVPGEEVVVFLKLNQRGQGVTIGLAQGKFCVWYDARTGRPFVHNPFHGRAAIATSPASRDANDGVLPLVELKRQVLEVLK